MTTRPHTPKKPAASLIGVIGIYLLLALIVFYGGSLLLTTSGLSRINGWLFFQTRVMIWAVLALLYLYAIRVEKQSFLPWPDKKYKPLFYAGSTFILLVIIAIGSGILMLIVAMFHREETSPKLLEYIKLFKNNVPLLIFTTLTAGVTEELIFRGYMQPRLEKAFNSPVVAIIITAFLFAALHTSYGTLIQFMVPLFIGILFSVFYSKYRNIKILILCHFLVDTLSLLALTFSPSKG
jgi:membrane protease YdiL (CAAX protease family)